MLSQSASVQTSSRRIIRRPKYLEDFVTNFAFDIFALSASDNIDVPKTYTEAMKDNGWRQAIEEEMKSLEDKKTWEIVDAPPDVDVIYCRWNDSSKRERSRSVSMTLSPFGKSDDKGDKQVRKDSKQKRERSSSDDERSSVECGKREKDDRDRERSSSPAGRAKPKERDRRRRDSKSADRSKDHKESAQKKGESPQKKSEVSSKRVLKRETAEDSYHSEDNKRERKSKKEKRKRAESSDSDDEEKAKKEKKKPKPSSSE